MTEKELLSEIECRYDLGERVHAPADWEYHPYVHHGWNGSSWTHPDLPYATGAGAASLGQISGEVSEVKAAPAGGKE